MCRLYSAVFKVYGHEYRTALLYVQAVSRLVFQLCTCRPCHVSCSSYVRAGRVTSRVPVTIMQIIQTDYAAVFPVQCDKSVQSTPRRKLIFVIVKCPTPRAPYMYMYIIYIYIYIYVVTFPRFLSLLCSMCALVSRFF